MYFNEPDHAGHVFGTNSKEVNEQIKESDNILGYLLHSLTKLDIYNRTNVVIVSDHGMVNVSEEKVINIDDFTIRSFYYWYWIRIDILIQSCGLSGPWNLAIEDFILN